jgi:photosystem II stability/assembly factor-like uncharacterized protein
MHTTSHLSLCAAICAVLLAGCTAQSASMQAEAPSAESGVSQATDEWEVILRTEPLGHKTTVAGFLNENFGITAGYAGEVHYTDDGGQTWPQAVNSSMCRFGLDIVGENLVWHIGNGGQVRYSEDGGRTWQKVTDVEIGLSQFISFIDARTGWAANSFRLVATGDGGATWTAASLPQGVTGIAAIDLRSESEGYLLDNAGRLHVTLDGGKTWTVKPLAFDGKLFVTTQLPTAAVRFTDSANGVVIAGTDSSAGSLAAWRTADGGETWTRETVPAKLGALHLTHDAKLLTVYGTDQTITLVRHP